MCIRDRSINDVLGGYAASTLPSGQTQLMFPFISTQPYDSLYLTSTRLSTSAVRGPRGNNNVLAMIIITEAFGNVQENAMPYDVWLDCSSLTTLSLDFQLVDRFGVPVDLTLGGEILFFSRLTKAQWSLNVCPLKNGKLPEQNKGRGDEVLHQHQHRDEAGVLQHREGRQRRLSDCCRRAKSARQNRRD